MLLFLACIVYILFLRNRNKKLSLLNTHIDISLKRYLGVFDTDLTGIEYFDKDGYLTDINDEARKILGIEESGEDFVNRRISCKDFESAELNIYKCDITADIPHEESDESTILDDIRFGKFLNAYVEYDLKNSKLAKYIVANGRDRITLNVKIIPIIVDGQFDGFVSMFIDITEQIQRRREIEKKNALMMNVFDDIPVAVFLKDTKTDKLIYWNNKSVEMFGEEVLLGANMFYNEEDYQRIDKIDRQILETGEMMIYRNTLRLKNGIGIDHIVHKSVIGDVEDGILVVAVVESTIKSELEKTNKIFSIKSNNIKAYTWDYNITTQKIEYTDDCKEPICKNDDYNDFDHFIQALSTENQIMVRKLFDDAKNGLINEIIYDYSIFNIEKNKIEYWESRVIVEDVNSVDGIQRHLYGIDIEITNRVELIQKLEDSKKCAEKANESKSIFLANMSHEIRTPLNAIVGFSNLLIDAENIEDRKEFSNIIDINSNVLLDLINSILDISKIEAGMVDFKYEVFDVSELIDEAIFSFKQRFERDELKISHEKSHEVCCVELDRERLLQIITNFMSNAVKFTTKGSIILGYTYSDGKLRIYVKDTGVGIQKSDVDKVFNRFEKLNNFAQGTGLGMYICKVITKLLAGNIGVESEYGKGSTFWVELPCIAKIE